MLSCLDCCTVSVVVNVNFLWCLCIPLLLYCYCACKPLNFLLFYTFLTEDWRYRHAALMAISACGEGCHSHMELMLQNIIDAILPFLTDSVSMLGFEPIFSWKWGRSARV